MTVPGTRAKAALAIGWVPAGGAVVVAGRSEHASGVLLVPAGVLLLIAARWGVLREYNGWNGMPRMSD